jgi:hypothetical protein
MSQRQLTDSELTAIQTKMEDLNLKIQKQEVTPDEALKQAYAERDLLRETLDRSNVTDLRRETWTVVQDSISVFSNAKYEAERSAGPKFKADTALDIGATKRCNDAEKVIRAITLNGKKTLTKEELLFSRDRNEKIVSDEKHGRIILAMLNNYGKYIDKDHPRLKKLWQMYNDKTISNYMEYAKSMYRNPNRDKQLIEKIKANQGNYSDSQMVVAVMTLLQGASSIQDLEEGSRKRKNA